VIWHKDPAFTIQDVAFALYGIWLWWRTVSGIRSALDIYHRHRDGVGS
jgi:hypothetical protein